MVEWFAAAAAWVAAVVALVSAVAAWAFSWWRRPEADWAIGRDAITVGSALQEQMFIDGLRLGGRPQYFASFTNVGDGSAFDIRVTAFGCQARMMELDARDERGFRTLDVVPVAVAGDHFLVALRVDDDVEEWGLRVEWTQAPTRHQRRLAQGFAVRRGESEPRQRPAPLRKWDGLRLR